MAMRVFTSGMPLRHRLLLLTLLTSGVGLLLGSITYLLIDLRREKINAREDLQSTADLIGTNAGAALAFDDALTGAKLLEALRTRPAIRGAALYQGEGKFFASYLRPDMNGRYVFPGNVAERNDWTGDGLVVTRAIRWNDRTLGWIVIESDLTDLRERTRASIGVAAVISAALLALIYFLTQILGRAITGPIQELAQTAREIAEHKDYSQRARPLAGKEMRQLGADFNQMLAEISRRDAELVEARDQMEMRVIERTRELEIEIGERERAESALRQSEQMFRTLSAAAPVGIVQMDISGKMTYVNPAWLEMTGLSYQESLHDGWRRAIVAEDLPRIEAIRSKAIQEGRDYKMSYRFNGPKGVVWVDTISRAIRDKGGKHLGYVAVTQDVTQRERVAENLRRAKETAEAASLAKTQFLANMSHEIRTPMNGIIGMTELALDTELSAEQRSYLSMVKSSAEALLGIINDILDFSKVEAGRVELESAVFSLSECIEEALRPLALRAQEKGLELTWSVDADVPEYLKGDSTRLRQILINLAGNAVKFTKEGYVSIRAERSQSSAPGLGLRVTVADTGIGIAPEKHRQIFEAFSQADASTTREFGGTGLGLSISARLAKLMGGDISVESEIGRGTKFIFTARFEAVAEHEIPAAPLQASALRGLRALVVDDNELNRYLLHRVLPAWGMEVALAENGEQAISLFEERQRDQRPISVVLMDRNMPGMGGFRTTEELRALPGGENVPVLLLTSSPAPEDQFEQAKLKIARRINKPIMRAELRDALLASLQATPVPVSPEPRDETPRSDRALRVLLVEDNAVNQKLALRLLEKMGHQVTLACNGKEAVDFTASAVFDVILMDIQMPVMGGVEATALIRKQQQGGARRTPIVAMTAHAMKGDREKYLSASMDGYVSKPIRKEVLHEEILRVAQLAVPRRQHAAPEVSGSPAETVLDRERLLERADHDGELFREILAIFQTEAAPRRAELRAAVESGSAEEVRAFAHAFKGMLANLAAGPATTAAAILENLAKAGSGAALTTAWQELERQLDLVVREVEHLLAGTPQ